MKPGKYYRLQWDTMDSPGRIASQTVLVQIYDLSVQIPDDDDAEVIELIPAGSPLEISVIDNSQDKFTPIRAKQARIRFITQQDQGLDLTTFADAPDNNFYVTISSETKSLFIGFLSLPDNSQPFQPDPQIVELIASDHLGALKDIPLTDDNGLNPTGKWKIGELIALCLKKTGLSLSLKVINNLRAGMGRLVTTAQFANTVDGNFITLPASAGTFFTYIGQQFTLTGAGVNDGTYTVTGIGHGIVTIIAVAETVTDAGSSAVTLTDAASTGHIYDKCYLDVLTFEEQIGESEDCYTVLQKILGEDCFLFQLDAQWWIIRIDEYDLNQLLVANFNIDGEYTGQDPSVYGAKNIGFANDTLFANADTLLQMDRPHQRIKETFKYEYPEELVCNENFSRGDFISDLPSETNADGVTQQVKKYNIECWDFLSKQGGGAPNTLQYYGQPPVSGTDAYIKRFFYNDTETNREVIIQGPPGSGAGVPYIKSQAVDASIGDKVKFSADLRYTNFGSSTGFVNSPVLILLYTNTGKIYSWKAYNNLAPDAAQQWIQITLTDVVPNWYEGANVQEETNMDFESPPIPESGKLYILLLNQYAGSINSVYTNVQLDITPFINGSYARYDGHYNQVTRNPEGGYLAKRDKEVFIGDAPRKAMKGGIFVQSGTDYVLAPLFWTANTFGFSYPPSTIYMHPYGYTQAFSVWNQFRNANRIFSGSLLGLGADYADLLQFYILTDTNPNTINRYFLLISFNQNWKSGIWSGTFIEVFRTDIGHVYSDTHEFKYITPNG